MSCLTENTMGCIRNIFHFVCSVWRSNIYFSSTTEVHKQLVKIILSVSVATHTKRIFLTPYYLVHLWPLMNVSYFFVIMSQAAQFQEKNYLPLNVCFEFLYHFI
jgi:hypothetical protein